MAHVCWIPKATISHTGCLILFAFPLQQWLHERASMLQVHCVYCCSLQKARMFLYYSESSIEVPDAVLQLADVRTKVWLKR